MTERHIFNADVRGNDPYECGTCGKYPDEPIHLTNDEVELADLLANQFHRTNGEFCLREGCGMDAASCQWCGFRVCGRAVKWVEFTRSGKPAAGNVCGRCLASREVK